MFKRSWLLALLVLPVAIWHLTQLQIVRGDTDTQSNIPNHRYTETIPIYNVSNQESSALTIDNWQLAIDHFPRVETAVSPTTPIQKTGPAALAPGDVAHYEISLANTEAVTRTFQLFDTLPPQLSLIPDSTSNLTYDGATRTLSWEGQIPPGKLDMIITESAMPLPYLDLAAFGAANLCDEFLADGEDCRNTAVTFNLGINGYHFTLYGEPLGQITVSANGILLGGEQTGEAANGRFHWLPNGASPNYLLAGLWRDVDMSENGRFHAAILTGLIDGHDVFYAQWHDAPHADDPDATARHAIALVLDGVGGMNGHAFYIYDNIADPSQTTAQGFVIGVEDKTGERGVTYAYTGDNHPAQGGPPTAGTTLHLLPALFGKDYTRTFTYDAIVNAQVPETVVNTAVYTSDSPDPYLAGQWSTHYLAVRHLLYLPLFSNEVQP